LDNGSCAVAERSTTDPEVHGLNPDEALFKKKMASKNVCHFSQKDKLQNLMKALLLLLINLLAQPNSNCLC